MEKIKTMFNIYSRQSHVHIIMYSLYLITNVAFECFILLKVPLDCWYISYDAIMFPFRTLAENMFFSIKHKKNRNICG